MFWYGVLGTGSSGSTITASSSTTGSSTTSAVSIRLSGSDTGPSGLSWPSSSLSVCVCCSAMLRLTLISKLKRKSPLLGLVWLTARHDWLPRYPLLVVFPVCRTVLSQSRRVSPLGFSSVPSISVAENDKKII